MSRAAANSGRVLVVEDDEGIRDMLKYNLTAAGFSVQEASDGASGLRTARTSRPELVLLSYLLAFPGRVHTRDSLLENVWGREFTGERKTVDVHIRWLREKFAGRAPFEIVTVRGIGYRLDRQAAQIDMPAAAKEGPVGRRGR